MLAMNLPEFKLLFDKVATDRFARRILFEHLEEPFIKQVNINIQVNNQQVNNQVNNQTHFNFSEAKAQEQQHVKDTLQAMKHVYLNK